MILHRQASSDFKAFKIAEVFDKFGLKIVTVYFEFGWFHVWAQGDEVSISDIDNAIDGDVQE